MVRPSPDQVDRIDRAVSYIDDHLGESLDLDTLAAIARFSKFHFHRLFKVVAGASPQEYVKRRRLEMAYHFLSNDSSLSVHALSDLLGFSSPSNFARSFRGLYAFPPSRLRGSRSHPPRRASLDAGQPFSILDPARVTLEALEPFPVLYRRVRGGLVPAQVEAALAALRQECARRGWTLAGAREVVLGRSIPGLIEPSRAVFDLGVEVPRRVHASHGAQVETVAGGTYARYEHRGAPTRIVECWAELYSIWLRRSGLSVGPGFGFTVLASEATQGSFLLYQPVRPGQALEP